LTRAAEKSLTAANYILKCTYNTLAS